MVNVQFTTTLLLALSSYTAMKVIEHLSTTYLPSMLSIGFLLGFLIGGIRTWQYFMSPYEEEIIGCYENGNGVDLIIGDDIVSVK